MTEQRTQTIDSTAPTRRSLLLGGASVAAGALVGTGFSSAVLKDGKDAAEYSQRSLHGGGRHDGTEANHRADGEIDPAG